MDKSLFYTYVFTILNNSLKRTKDKFDLRYNYTNSNTNAKTKMIYKYETPLWVLYDEEYYKRDTWRFFLKYNFWRTSFINASKNFNINEALLNDPINEPIFKKHHNGYFENLKNIVITEEKFSINPQYCDYVNWYLSNLFLFRSVCKTPNDDKDKTPDDNNGIPENLFDFKDGENKDNPKLKKKHGYIKKKRTPNQGDFEYYYKCNILLWYEFYKCLRDELNNNSQYCNIFKHPLNCVNEFIMQYGKFCSLRKNASEGLPKGDFSKYYELCDDNVRDFEGVCKRAAEIFWMFVICALQSDYNNSKKINQKINCFTIFGGNNMAKKSSVEPMYIDAYQTFNTNPCFQKVYAALLEDYMHLKDDTSAKSKLLENVSKGEIISYMLFIKNLPLIDQQFEIIYELFHYPITLAFNNPVVQKIIFEMEDMFADVNEFYIKYYHRVELECKFGSNVHTTKHEFLDAIPLIRYNFTDAKVINQFMKSDMHKGCIFKWHLYGETFGIFRLRLATKNDVPTIVDANKHKIDKKEFIATEPKEAEQAVLKNQLFIIEEAVGKRSKTEYFSDDELNIADENYQLAAFALMCPEIFTDVDYGKTINKEIGCRLEEHAVFNTGFVVDHNETVKPEKDSGELKDNYRGYGFQRLFLGALTEMARVKGKKYAVCTVSPENKVSYGNIRAFGYEKIKEIEYDIDGVKYKRDFCQLYL